ncbi:MAG: chlorophyll a/b-binding protein [Prochlorococcaceae cyanobacterium]
MYFASPESEAGWGFHARAELLNGRLAMLGFVIGVILELLTGQGILQQIGLSALLHQS